MNTDIIAELHESDNKKAYALLQQLEMISEESSELYGYLEDFIEMTVDLNSFIRVRGFRLACAQAKWDAENRLNTDLDMLLRTLDDEKPTAVRQCLAALHKVVICKPDLGERILRKMDEMDLSKYKDSMALLIRKDMEALARKISENQGGK